MPVGAVVVALFVFAAVHAPDAEHWPPHVISPELKALGEERADLARQPKYLKASDDAAPYDPSGVYMHISRKMAFENSDTMRLDGDGLPLVKYAGDFYYNPATLSNYALSQYEAFLNGSPIERMKVAVHRLLSLQRPDGAFENNFNYAHHSTIRRYKTGWTSGFTQGLALSALARIYHATNDGRYLDAGNRALAFIQVPYPRGPMYDMRDLDPSLRGYSFINEYSMKIQAYNLAGYGYTIIGLYDWWKLTGSEDAHRLYDDAIRTYAKIVPYFDVGTFSAYDLSYITLSREPYLMPYEAQLNPTYHALHIELMDVMYFLTSKPVFKEYADKWRKDVAPKQSSDS